MRSGLQPDSESDVLVPPPDQPDLQFAVSKGLWVEVVSWEGVRDHPEVLKELMRSENFDQACGLPADEVGFLADIYHMAKDGKTIALPGEREFDAVLRKALNTPGQPFKESDVEARYNLSKVIGCIHLNFITEFCSVFVDFKKSTVNNKCYNALAKLHAKCPWLKVCLLCDNYSTEVTPGQGNGKKVADNWDTNKVKDIIDNFGDDDMLALERYVADFLSRYVLIPGCSQALVHKT